MNRLPIISAIFVAIAFIFAGLAASGAFAATNQATTQPSGTVYVCVNDNNSAYNYYEFRAPVPHTCENGYSLWTIANATPNATPSPRPTPTLTTETQTITDIVTNAPTTKIPATLTLAVQVPSGTHLESVQSVTESDSVTGNNDVSVTVVSFDRRANTIVVDMPSNVVTADENGDYAFTVDYTVAS